FIDLKLTEEIVDGAAWFQVAGIPDPAATRMAGDSKRGMMADFRQKPTIEDAAYRKVEDLDYLGTDTSKLERVAFRFRTKKPLDGKALESAVIKLRESYRVRVTAVNAPSKALGWVLPISSSSRPETDGRCIVELFISLGGSYPPEFTRITVEPNP